MIPITLVTGFLEGGKTTTIMNILKNKLTDLSGTTLIIDMEDEGEEKYDQAFLKMHNIILVEVEEPGLLNHDFLQELEDAYKPDQIFIEYNGMFKLKLIEQIILPKGWELERQLTVVDASCFDLYMRNLKGMFKDMVRKSSVVIFNRCLQEYPLQDYKKLVESSNKQAIVIFEDYEGQVITCI